MANNPQLENGYLRIANELYDAILKFPFSKRELLVVLAVVRKTYGYGKKRDDISLSQIAKMTGLNAANVSRSINDLAAMKVLLKQQGQHAQTIEVIKDYASWVVLPKQQHHCQNNNRGIAKLANQPLPKRQPQKTTPKDNIQKGAFVLPEWIDKELWSVWMQVRTKKRSVNTDIALNNLVKKLEKIRASGITPEFAITTAIEKSWQGIDLSWLQNLGADTAPKSGAFKPHPSLQS